MRAVKSLLLYYYITNIILYKRRKFKVVKETLNYVEIINLKVKVKNTMNIITTTISRIKMSKDNYWGQLKNQNTKCKN